MADAFHITAKPIGATCNMRCKYCYFLAKKDLLGSYRKTDDALLEKFIIEYSQAQKSDRVFFTWHGGEPTLLGLDFFKRVVELQKKHCPPEKKIANDLQTNGLLIDEDWCRFLKENNFLVGLSIDGRAEDNAYRTDVDGNETHTRVTETARLLQKHNVEFNTLTVVNPKNGTDGKKVYRFLRDEIGSKHIQFLPLVELKGHETTAPFHHKASPEVEDFSIKPEEWGRFLLDIFDEWYTNDIGKVFVYMFENFLSIWLGMGATSCLFAKQCGNTMAMDSDGSIYACDHFSYPEYRYGNINEQPISKIVSCKKRQLFEELKKKLPRQCLDCKWLFACNGECPKKRFMKTVDGEEGLNYLCAGYRMLFEGINDRLNSLAERYKGTSRQLH